MHFVLKHLSFVYFPCAGYVEKLFFYVYSALESRQYGGNCSVICY
jgi:hypothetical protein